MHTSSTTTADMARVAVHPDGIPDELKLRNQWVNWLWELRDGKWTKAPYHPNINRRASVTNLTTWKPFVDALNSYTAGKYHGMGFVLCSGDPYTFIDLDDCRNPENGEIEEWAQEWIDRFDGYTDVSPTGTGLHILVRGKSPHNGKTTLRGKKVEIYSTERFTTITGVRP